MISPISWINGFSALALVSASFIFAFYFVYIYWKTKNNILLNGAILGIACAFGWMGITLSFLSVVIYGYNLPGLKLSVNILSYSTMPIGSMAILNIAWEMLLPPKHKKKVLMAIGIFSIFYYIVLFMTFNSAVVCPDVPPGEIYDDWLSSEELPYYLIYVLISGITIIFAIGILRFFKVVIGDLRKRAIWIIIATPIMGSCILLDTVIITDAMFQDLLFIVRFLMIVSLFCTYKGFKPPEEKIIDSIKEDRVDDVRRSAIERMFASRPEKITEEEIKFYKEKTICLVCRKEETGFINLFICPECKALYCEKCARALIKLENACWACNEAIDKSKPVKLPEKEEEKVIVEEKKTKKKPTKIK
ncbi:MAG: hypothetical protein EU529_05695 [Promethearchaeota archaeon]|nr:MAG: hypothetical protein EU529_05695 [Candidatus Lokiarchaeota archaeon]